MSSPRLPIVDERGYLMEMLRSDAPDFKGFGQTYLTAVNEGVVKAGTITSARRIISSASMG